MYVCVEENNNNQTVKQVFDETKIKERASVFLWFPSSQPSSKEEPEKKMRKPIVYHRMMLKLKKKGLK